MKNVAFYLGLGALLTHELDAMTNHEWRVLPLVRGLPDDVAMNAFVWLHVPIYAALIALIASSNERLRAISRLAVAAFLVIHAGLHALFHTHPAYEFSSMTSNALIVGAAAMGAVYLVIEFADRR